MTQYPPTIRNEILDNILGLLSSFEDPEFKDIFKKTNPVKIDMDYIAKALQKNKWESQTKEAIKQKLITENYITEDKNGNLSITHTGLEFQKNGGYYLQELNQPKEKSTNCTLEKIKRKINWQLGLIALAIFIIQILSIDYVLKFFKQL
ncbi:hypothetical protein [uncultured Formosa sp.]|uniref:hypothetical protein n=1 Tax=uncultured Formosa sp. TaxID=255435 RepID=UPI00262BE264|nr:hypothetical protein [uncultured Formosa sp.]